MPEVLSYEFVQNAIAAALLASLLCGLVGTFVVVKRLVFVSGGISHAAFGGLGIFYYFGLPPLAGAATTALLAAALLSGRRRWSENSQDALIGILWAVGMALGVLFIARTPGFAPDLTSYLFGDILAVSRGLLIALMLVSGVVALSVIFFFKELLAVAFDEEYARSQGVPTRGFLVLIMILIAISVVLLIQVVGVVLAIALLTIPPVISLSLARSFRGVMLLAIALGCVQTLGGLWLSFAYDLPSGPTIVLVGFAMLLISKLSRRLRSGRSRAALVGLLALGLSLTVGCQSAAIAPPTHPPTEDSSGAQAVGDQDYVTPYRHLEFLGEATIAPTMIDGAPTGGLSGLTWAGGDRFYAVSDDRAERGAARFYTLAIDLSGGTLDEDGVEVLGWTALTDENDRRFVAGGIDPEAIAITGEGNFILASEGKAAIGLAPFLREFSADGRQLRDFPLGEGYMPSADGDRGVRENMALESAALSPDGRYLFSATENALEQDGPPSTLEQASPGRILRYDLDAERIDAEYLYWIEPVVERPDPAEAFHTAGVVEVVALDDQRLLVLERSFSLGRGNDVRIFAVDLSQADNILGIAALAEHGTDGIQAARKDLLLHVDALGIESDNLEGMAFGPDLADGRRTLLLASDNNFNLEMQENQFLAFALGTTAPSIALIQGSGHTSPFDGDWVRGVEGVVTRVDPHPKFGGFWLQSTGAESDESESDIELGTSTGIFVGLPGTDVLPGDRVRVDGAVAERGRKGSLSVTRIEAESVRTIASGVPIPPPVRLGGGGVALPTVIAASPNRFDPCCDAIDLYESLEGMRVELLDPVVVGGTTRFGEIAVLADAGKGAELRSPAGGVVLRPDNANPQRVLLDDRVASDVPEVAVGQNLGERVEGVMDYSFGNFKLVVDSWPVPGEPPPEVSPLRPNETGEISIASYNVLNLDANDPEQAFRHLAASIVDGLGSPTFMALQEVQDDNGADDEGVVSAEQTLGRLVDAIEAAGGPHYEYLQIDPGHNADGGQPNGNIRVVWLFDPTGGARLQRPERIAVDHVAFAGDASRGWGGGRKCLAADAEIGGHRLLLINCHLKSKFEDDRLYGTVQPPVFSTEAQRSEQITAVLGYIGRRTTADPDLAVVLAGDMNDHDFRPPMRLAVEGGLINLLERVPENDRYSYNFNGNSQLLDHILVTPALAPSVSDVAILHINAGQAAARRSSDHDPVLIRLRLLEVDG